MKKFHLLAIIVFLLFPTFVAGQLRLESEEQALERQIRTLRLKHKLENAKKGIFEPEQQKPANSSLSIKMEAEIHKCSNNGYHNTGYEHFCFDMYFYTNGTVYWNRRRYNKVLYNDELSGHYSLELIRPNYYKLYITWSNGYQMEGKVICTSSKDEIHLENFVFDAQ